MTGKDAHAIAHDLANLDPQQGNAHRRRDTQEGLPVPVGSRDHCKALIEASENGELERWTIE